MEYLKVKAKSDQIRKHANKTDVLVANELYTLCEVNKMNLSEEFIREHFINVEVSKNKTYFLFGARFAKGLILSTFDLPDFWASALINEDYSGLENSEEAEIRAFYAEHGGINCVSCDEFERIGRYKGLLTNMNNFTFDVSKA